MTALPPTHGSLPPAGRLLLLAAQMRPDAGTEAQLAQAITEGGEWERFLTTAHAHGVHPLVAQTLLASVPELVPAREQQVLRGWLHRTLARNLLLVRALGEILAAFQAAAIPVVCLKGPGLAVALYGGLEARACNDLDLMVPPAQLEQALAQLQAIGFGRTFPHLTPEERAFFRPDSLHHQNFIRERDQVVVELHWGLGHDPNELPLEASFWQRCEQVTVEGVSLPVLPRAETPLYLAGHAAAHGWNVLRHLCDFHEAARRLAPVDWDGVAAQAGRTGQAAVLGVTALLVQEYFGAAIPGPVGRLTGTSRRIHWLARQASRGLHKNLRLGTFHAPPFVLPWLIQPGIVPWLRRIEALSHPCLHERNWVRLPRPFWPLYYALRPIRLALKYGRRVVA